MKNPTLAPVFACLYPCLCKVARDLGYALAIHGTVTTDLDLIAVPWTDRAVDALTLKNALLDHIGAVGYRDLLRNGGNGLSEDHIQQIVETELCTGPDDSVEKPHGRLAWNLYLVAGSKVDLSVMPKLAKP